MLGKEAAVFLPSGTMCNEIAIAVHCRPGDEIITDRTTHIVNSEGGGPAALSGVMIRTIDGERGVFGADAVRAALRSGSRYEPRSRMLSLEQTSNFGGGRVWPLETLRGTCAAAREAGLICHLDGARLMNAVVASSVPAATWAEPFDTLWLDFTKGLGAPVGAVLAGSRAFIAEAWRLKQRWGGAMRQAGIIAAAGLYALDHHVERLAEDHANARRLAEGLAALPGVSLHLGMPETNLVFFDVGGTGMSAEAVVAVARAQGVQIGVFGPTQIRAVTHLDVDEAAVDAALAVLGRILRGA
jgi:threonine aldolase